jgi:hypothetical protein
MCSPSRARIARRCCAISHATTAASTSPSRSARARSSACVASPSLPADLLESLLQRAAADPGPPPADRSLVLLAWAENQRAAGRYLLALETLDRLLAEYPDAGPVSLASALRDKLHDSEHAPELGAQRDLALMLGGAERPARSLAPDAASELGEKLTAFADGCRADAPRTAEQARSWARILRGD